MSIINLGPNAPYALVAEAGAAVAKLIERHNAGLPLTDPEPEPGSSAREAELEAQLADADRLAGRMARILNATAAALKGDPAENHLHGWADLPEVAISLLRDAYRAGFDDSGEGYNSEYGCDFDSSWIARRDAAIRELVSHARINPPKEAGETPDRATT